MVTKIDFVLEDLKNCKDGKQVYQKCVEDRLQKSLDLYDKESRDRKLYLRYKSEYSVLRKYRRMLKDNEV